jgi:hypothetical protein
MAEFWVGVKGELGAEQGEVLQSAGIPMDELR